MILLVSGATVVVDAHPEVGRLIVPAAGNAPESVIDGRQWAMDNGAFSGLDVSLFLRMLRRFRGCLGCLFVTVPDVVGDHAATLELFWDWLPTIRSYGFPAAFVLQDGCSVKTVPWSSCEAVFIGGTTEFKLSRTAQDIAAYAKARGKWVHMGRVNSDRRIRHAIRCGVDSIDGLSFSRWSRIHIPRGLQTIRKFQGGPLLETL